MTRLARGERLGSLRWRLLAAVCAAVLLIWLLTGALSYFMARHEAEELMDGSLAQTGHLLLAILEGGDGELAGLGGRLASVRGADNIYEPRLEFQVGRGDGVVVARSLDAPELPILGVIGYSDIIRHHESWRVLNLESEDGRYRVQLSQPIGLRDRAALEVAGQTVLPLLFIVPLLFLLIYLSIRRGLLPLDRLASAVAARTPDNLAPLSGREVPTEARPLVSSINRLFARVSRALDHERRFTADAAHELRTPLAAIKVQSEVALRSTEAPMREKALRQISGGVDRAGRLLDQLLRLARLDPVQKLANPGPVDLGAVIGEVVAAARAACGETDRPFVAPSPAGKAMVQGDPELLGMALRNLLDNALRYSAPGGAVQIGVDAHDGEIDVTVRDCGPGVSAEVLDKLGERFFRGPDTRAEGSGLGLAIVKRIAELHGARLVLGNHPDGGFVAQMQGLKGQEIDFGCRSQ